MKVKASAGNRAKHTIITKRYPNQTTITTKELRQVSLDNPKDLLAADGRTSLAYYITRHNGTGKRGVYHLPKLVNGFFITPDDEVSDADLKKVAKSVATKSPKKKVEDIPKSSTLPNDDSLLGYIPDVDSTYVKFGHHKDIVQILKSNLFYPIFVTGLSGNGKTFGVEQACAETKRELVRVNITIETDEDDLLGGFRLVDGNTEFHKGPVVEALERGAVLLLDEVDLASSKILCLQPILEGKGVFLKKTNEWVQPADGFTIIATANTKGKGSESGAFVGTTILNEAFIDRFAITLEQAYPPVTTETKIVKNVFKSLGVNDDDFATHLVNWADITRKTFYDGGVDEIIATRRLVHIANAYAIFGDRLKAVELCISRFDEDTKIAFKDLYEKCDGSVGEQIPEVKSENLDTQPF
jgi:hypothetical protein